MRPCGWVALPWWDQCPLRKRKRHQSSLCSHVEKGSREHRVRRWPLRGSPPTGVICPTSPECGFGKGGKSVFSAKRQWPGTQGQSQPSAGGPSEGHRSSVQGPLNEAPPWGRDPAQSSGAGGRDQRGKQGHGRGQACGVPPSGEGLDASLLLALSACESRAVFLYQG